MIFFQKNKQNLNPEVLYKLNHAKATQAKELDLTGMRIREIPEEIYDLDSITRLYLGLNANIKKELQNNQQDIHSLSKQEKSRNKLQSIPETLFTKLTHLEHIDLSYNQIKNFPETVNSHSCIASIDLSYNNISDQEAKSISASLRNITSLCINDNNIGKAGSLAIAASLRKLTSLNMSNNNIGDEGAKAIAASIAHLNSLNLNNNKVGDDGAKAIAASLGKLELLDLSNNNIGDEGAKAIAASLGHLTSLNLNNNSIGDDGAKAIAASMGQLTYLDLSYNGIGGETIDVFHASFEPKLKVLNSQSQNILVLSKEPIMNNLSDMKFRMMIEQL